MKAWIKPFEEDPEPNLLRALEVIDDPDKWVEIARLLDIIRYKKECKETQDDLYDFMRRVYGGDLTHEKAGGYKGRMASLDTLIGKTKSRNLKNVVHNQQRGRLRLPFYDLD